MNKPKFDPSQAFEAVKPKFDPSQPFGSVDVQAPQASTPMNDDPSTSAVTTATTGVIQGSLAGFGDEMGAAGSTALNAITGMSGPLAGGSIGDLFDEYHDRRNALRKEFEAAHAAHPAISTAAQIAGSLATGGLAGGAPSTLGQAALQGTGIGAVNGLGASNADLTQGDFKGAAIDTAKGAGIGTVAGVAGYGLGKVVSGIVNPGQFSEGLKDTADLASAKAMGAERGTIKALGADKVKEIGRYGLDEGVVSPFASTEDLLARNEALKAKGGQMMGDVYSTIDDAGASTFNPLDTAAKIEDKVGDFWRSPINKGETNQLENTLESVLQRGDQNIPMTEAQALKEELGKVANWKSNVAVTDKERMARDAYGVVNDEIDRATQAGADSIGSPELLETLKQGKSLYSNATGAGKLLDNKFAKEVGNKTFGITDAGWGAGSLAAAVPTHGVSLLAVPAKKIAEKYGNQVVAVGADKLADVLAKTPEIFGKFAPVLQEAAQRGGNSLAVTHFILQQQDPAYREQVKQSLGTGE